MDQVGAVMTISQQYHGGSYWVTCDGCGDVEELEGGDFTEALADAKARHGYTVSRVDGQWMHFCQVCEEDD